MQTRPSGSSEPTPLLQSQPIRAYAPAAHHLVNPSEQIPLLHTHLASTSQRTPLLHTHPAGSLQQHPCSKTPAHLTEIYACLHISHRQRKKRPGEHERTTRPCDRQRNKHPRKHQRTTHHAATKGQTYTRPRTDSAADKGQPKQDRAWTVLREKDKKQTRPRTDSAANKGHPQTRPSTDSAANKEQTKADDRQMHRQSAASLSTYSRCTGRCTLALL